MLPFPRPLSSIEQALISTATSLAAKLDVDAVCAAILDAAEQIYDARSAWILLHDAPADRLRTVAFRGLGADVYANVSMPCNRGIVGLAFTRNEPVFVPDVDREDRWFDPKRLHESGLQTVFTVPLVHDRDRMGVLGLDSPHFSAGQPPSTADLALMRALAAQAAVGIKNAKLFQEADEDRQRLRRLVQERRHLRTQVGQLRSELRDAQPFDGVIGNSPALRDVIGQVNVVAPAESTVLLIGETGTGKELIARAIHSRSRRAQATLVAVNCAALPESLVESELFGHEKGAFTGAVARKAGKFELADRGTLFLDEIGDLPLEAQAKLLRVLQEREVQRVGGTRPLPVNVRLVAATNQDLQSCMEVGKFRQDLFYRLSVFPIVLPPLRDRREDVPALVAHFVARFARALHKAPPRVSEAAMRQLLGYDWPGNIRELQNVIERAVILAHGPVIGPELVTVRPTLRPPFSFAAGGTGGTAVAAVPPLGGTGSRGAVLPFSEAERHAILRALESTGWRISGQGGAADLLGLKATTLHAKMKRLGIRRPTAAQSA